MVTSIITRKKPTDIERRERPYYHPFSLMREFDDLFDDFRRNFGDFYLHPQRRALFDRTSNEMIRMPAMDLRDKGEYFLLTAEIPGINKDDMEITLTDERIEIKAELTLENKDENDCYICQERRSSSFHRMFEFPEHINAENAEAKLENGILEVILPKKEPVPKTEARKLEIK